MTPEQIQEDGRRSYECALSALRAEYLAHRRPGESAAEYIERTRTIPVDNPDDTDL